MKKLTLAALLIGPAVVLSSLAFAQNESTAAPNAMSRSAQMPAADNSKSNREDPTNQGNTADRQKNDATDIDLVKRIRRNVMQDKDLSTYGHNVKIVAVNGSVTLNGVVKNADEKKAINQMAVEVAGAGHVVDDLKVTH